MDWYPATAGSVGLVLGLGNALWSYKRWREDRSYVAWSLEVDREDMNDLAKARQATLSNSGTATAFDVEVAWFTKTFQLEPPTWFLPGDQWSHIAAGVPVRTTPSVDGSAMAVRITWRDRPDRAHRAEDYSIPGGRLLPRAPWRERLGDRIAGRPKPDPMGPPHLPKVI